MSFGLENLISTKQTRLRLYVYTLKFCVSFCLCIVHECFNKFKVEYKFYTAANCRRKIYLSKTIYKHFFYRDSSHWHTVKRH